MEFLQSQPYIKTKRVSSKKTKLAKDLQQAIKEVKLHQERKIQLKTAEQLLDEL